MRSNRASKTGIQLKDVQEAADKAVPGPLHNTYGGTM